MDEIKRRINDDEQITPDSLDCLKVLMNSEVYKLSSDWVGV